MLVDHSRKVAYCLIPKTGVTTWKMFMANNTLNGKHIPNGVDTKMWIHSRLAQFDLTKEKIFVFTGELYESDDSSTSIWSTYFCIITTRHFPHYINNGSKILKYPRKPISSFALQNYHQGDTNIDKDNYNATFWEFVQHTLVNRNVHWAQYNNRCGQCIVDYDFIMRTETLQRDSTLFLSQNYPEITSLPAY